MKTFELTQRPTLRQVSHILALLFSPFDCGLTMPDIKKIEVAMLDSTNMTLWVGSKRLSFSDDAEYSYTIDLEDGRSNVSICYPDGDRKTTLRARNNHTTPHIMAQLGHILRGDRPKYVQANIISNLLFSHSRSELSISTINTILHCMLNSEDFTFDVADSTTNIPTIRFSSSDPACPYTYTIELLEKMARIHTYEIGGEKLSLEFARSSHSLEVVVATLTKALALNEVSMIEGEGEDGDVSIPTISFSEEEAEEYAIDKPTAADISYIDGKFVVLAYGDIEGGQVINDIKADATDYLAKALACGTPYDEVLRTAKGIKAGLDKASELTQQLKDILDAIK